MGPLFTCSPFMVVEGDDERGDEGGGGTHTVLASERPVRIDPGARRPQSRKLACVHALRLQHLERSLSRHHVEERRGRRRQSLVDPFFVM